jgi:ubiquinone biosynthesis protein
MLREALNLQRLHEIGATLARYDAFFPFQELPLPGPVTWMMAVYRQIFGRRDPRPPGQRLAEALTVLGPTFIKLGQALSVRPDLIGAEIAADLGQLRDRLPPFPFEAARAAVEAELGRPLDTIFSSFDESPVAAASIAQVHFAITTEGRKVAVKLLRPGIEQAFQRDLDLMYWLANLVERAAPRFRRLKPREVVETVARAVSLELDLRLEAAAASELAENFRDDPDLNLPAVDWQRTGRRMITMARIDGMSVDDIPALDAAGLDRPEIAARVIRVFLKQALRDGFFHADLHHGNLFVDRDGGLIAIDFGIMGRLDKATRGYMADMLFGFVSADYRRVAEVHFTAGYVQPPHTVEVFGQACRAIGEPILGRPVAEISIGRLLGQLFEVTEMFGMPTQPHLLLLQKTMVRVEGVARSLDPEINFWTVSRPVVEEWLTGSLSPPARIKDDWSHALDMLRKLPSLVERLESRLDGILTEDGLRLDPESARRLALAEKRANRPIVWAGWATVGLLAVMAAVSLGY